MCERKKFKHLEKAFPILLLSFLYLAFFSTAADVTATMGVVNCNSTLTQSTILYSDLNGTGTCFVIGADSITLDCAGYTITGAGGGAGVNASERKNITIKNCNIRNFTVGINFTRTNFSTIFNNTVRNNSYGAWLVASDSNNISWNGFYNNSPYGLYFTSSFNASVFHNNASNNSGSLGAGVRIDLSASIDSDSWNHTFYNNTFSNNGKYGLSVLNSNFLNITSNRVFNNYNDEIYFYRTNNSFIFHNTAYTSIIGNGMGDNECENNTYYNNTIYNVSTVF